MAEEFWEDAKLQAILHDPCTSGWLIQAIHHLMQRDPVDAIRDAEVLVELMKDRCNAALGIKE